ncbi:hypothetical protein SDC9_198002 [bioreactor metagenome]|uniref:Uncharacterized protein n=1 Tax=bioreactor metagenome TaxID=1076179 RepID=A0A645IHA5_9ZZZZ
MFQLEPSGLALHLHDRDAGRVIDEDFSLGQRSGGPGNIVPVGLIQVAQTHLVHVNAGL